MGKNYKNLFNERIIKYPVKTKMLGIVDYVNLDNAATVPPFADTEKVVFDFVTSYGSVHRGAGEKSQVSTAVYEQCRQTIKKFVDAPEDFYVLFTGNTTGAMNTLAYFLAQLPGKIAVSEIEHSASYLPFVKAEGQKELGDKRFELEKISSVNELVQAFGFQQVLTYSLNDDFEFDLEALEKILQKEKIKAVVVTASSNLTGYTPDLKKIGELVKKYHAYFIVDACQFIQHHEISMKELGIDFLAASGHKFYAPYGGGFLIGPKKFLDNFLPYQIGGGNLPYITQDGYFVRYENEQAHDPGTPNAIGAVAMKASLENLQSLGLKNIADYEKKLVKKVYDELKKNKKVKLYVSEKHLNTVIPFTLDGMTYKETAQRLNDDYGIGLRAGNFCVYAAIRKMLNIKNDEEITTQVKNGNKDVLPGVVRASFSLCNDESDADRFVAAINEMTK
ncbi:MAG TPA: aminotransferase class V-fold PLP-dependent enzyme [Candidatus Magasanikbacteria bacterium]|mgnify:FL=1|nr:aminotransferase class V-fold PLP-dependent enzyme [Candidatus Magasanikbacteria bacterium]